MRRRASLALPLLALGACEYGAGVAPVAKPRMAVQAVLNPAAGEQVLLVERTLVNGRHCASPLGEPGAVGEVAPCVTDTEDPIVAAGGEPISGAAVVVYGPGGDSAVAVEDLERRGDGKGAGVYRFTNAALPPTPSRVSASLSIVPGATYTLRVTTELGTASARTTIPNAPIVAAAPLTRFNVERGDVVNRSPVAAGGAAGYLALVDAPIGNRLRRLYDVPIALTAFGGSVFAIDPTSARPDSRFQVNLVPGLLTEARVSALDSNYVRALRVASDEDPFSSENPGSSIEGGVGLFGSLVPVSLVRLDVVSFVDEPIEGRYVLVEGPSAAPGEMRLYSYRGALSGSFPAVVGTTTAVFGTRGANPPVRLDFYSDRLSIVRTGTFEGRYTAGELRGTFTVEGSSVTVPTVYLHTP